MSARVGCGIDSCRYTSLMHPTGGNYSRDPRRNVRPRIPIAYAGLLIIALVAVIGFAAFSPSPSTPSDDADVPIALDTSSVASARVASAVLAVRIADSETRVATTQVTVEEPSADEEPVVDDEPVVAQDGSAAEDEASEDTAPPDTASATTTPRDTTPPPISVTSHKDGHTVTQRIITFYGTSEPAAVVSSGPYKAEMEEDGDWELSLVVVDGANGASFEARDEAGNTSSVRIVVHYEESQSTTTQPAPKTTTTQPASKTTTTKAPTSSKWSPNWPADSGGIRDVEYWRSTVEKYWPASRVDCALGIIQRESKGDPRAYNSSSSAEGLMQHLSKYWVSRAKGAGFVDGNGLVATPFNGEANIAAGAYLANYYSNSIGQWWNPWKSGSAFTANYGTCQSGNPS